MTERGSTHCLVDCFAHIVRHAGGLEHRPLYIGVWDAPFALTDTGFSYYSGAITFDLLLKHVAVLYGEKTEIRSARGEGMNAAMADGLERLHSRDPQMKTVLLTDLYHLPYSKYYNSRRCPHFLVLDGCTEQGWRLADPYLQWKGTLTKEALLPATGFGQAGLAMSIRVNRLRHPSGQAVAEVFEGCFQEDEYALWAAFRDFVRKVNGGVLRCGPGQLQEQAEQVLILAKRFRGYRVVESFFAAGDGIEADEEEAPAAELEHAWEQLLLLFLRYAMLGRGERQYRPLADKLAAAKRLEQAARERLPDRLRAMARAGRPGGRKPGDERAEVSLWQNKRKIRMMRGF